MNANLAEAMRAAMNLMRNQKVVEATTLIQGALSGVDSDSSQSPTRTQRRPLAIENRVIDLTAEIIEPETVASDETDTRSDQSKPSGITAWNAGARGKAFAKFPHSQLPRFGGLTVARPRKALEIPDGAQYLSRSFACAAGSRSYKVYIPRRPLTAKRALIIMLHGGTQDADDFAAGTRMNTLAEEHGFLVAYPNQSKTANASLCWNWFTPENQMRGRGEPAIIAGITSEIVGEYAVDPACVFVAGLSAGGAMAAVMGATYPDLYAAVGIHSGLPYESATDLPSAFAAMRGKAGLGSRRSRKSRPVGEVSPRMRTIIFHGDVDKIVHPSNADNMADAKAGESVEREARHTAARSHTRTVTRNRMGAVVLEQWLIHGGGHAWSGGSSDGTYADPHGPDASQEMVRFFLGAHSGTSAARSPS